MQDSVRSKKMKIKKLPPLDYLNECFELSEESSALLWKIRPRSHFPTSRGHARTNAQFARKSAGTLWTNPLTGKQYCRIRIAGSVYHAHRIIYSMFHSVELSIDTEIDHEDNNGLNNSPTNLRVATHGENQHNESLRKNNTSGVKGVNWHKASSMWQGRVMFNSKTYNLGLSPTKKVMEEIVKEFREKLHREFTNHGNV